MANIISIAVFMYIMTLCIGSIGAFDLFGTNQITTTPPGTLDPTATVSGWNFAQYMGNGWTIATFAVLSIFASVGLLFAVMGSWLSIAGIALNLGLFTSELFPFFPSSMIILLTAVVGIVYILGAIMFATGRSRRLGNA